jgi:hypothetical protein
VIRGAGPAKVGFVGRLWPKLRPTRRVQVLACARRWFWGGLGGRLRTPADEAGRQPGRLSRRRWIGLVFALGLALIAAPATIESWRLILYERGGFGPAHPEDTVLFVVLDNVHADLVL